ncbi:MAG TPA: nickel pincer cofactor biosynthesis protein LarB [Candidatus Limnocylindrales bacterium]|jgi:pyridinium-3,5-biscarboxylic acid mononucleotide synthase|nr:nickel pincer cofactor biosynthesis protein LarB [Candidatus Limnocylindrales bacterium]
MTAERLRRLLMEVAGGNTSVDAAFRKIRSLPFESLGMANVDHHRSLRQGVPEVILGEGKTVAQIAAIARAIRRSGAAVLITRLDPVRQRAIRKEFRGAALYPEARCAVIRSGKPKINGKGTILVVTAGTSDIPVAEEAAVTAEFLGNRVGRLFDVGVAGIHRLLLQKEALLSARVLVVVAGMEGALASVVGGLTDKPVIAVPTSVGYGASFGGVSALLGMLNSCSPTVAVVNIDNGFGAGVLSSVINRL